MAAEDFLVYICCMILLRWMTWFMVTKWQSNILPALNQWQPGTGSDTFNYQTVEMWNWNWILMLTTFVDYVVLVCYQWHFLLFFLLKRIPRYMNIFLKGFQCMCFCFKDLCLALSHSLHQITSHPPNWFKVNWYI